MRIFPVYARKECAQLNFDLNERGGELELADVHGVLDGAHHVGVKFSTNGTTMTPARARAFAAMDYLDIQISLDGARPASGRHLVKTGASAAPAGSAARG